MTPGACEERSAEEAGLKLVRLAETKGLATTDRRQRIESGHSAFTGSDSRRTLAIVLAIVLLGLVLRLVASLGDLWFDEIRSFALIEPLNSVWQIFWRINDDNNHFLNSVYLYFVGAYAPVLLVRAFSVALGVASVAAAALAATPGGRSAQIATALLFAVSYPMVHYGSEARGYGGLVLFTLLSVVFLKRHLDGADSRWKLAIIVLLGFLAHLTMLGTVVVLVAWTGWLEWRRSGNFRTVDRAIGHIFAPAFYMVLPLAACIVAGKALYGFTFGGYATFSLAAFPAGYGGMIRYLFGLPAWAGGWTGIAILCGCVCLAARLAPDRQSILYVAGIVLLPALMLAAHLPNMKFPRYFLISGTLILLWTGEMIGRGFDAGGIRRLLAAVAIVATLVASTLTLVQFHAGGRGAYSRMVDRMTRDGPTTYATSNDLRTSLVVDFYARRQGRQARLVPSHDWCAQRPVWFILEHLSVTPVSLKPAPDCTLEYERVDSARPWGLSGIAWTLYRRRG